MDLVDNIPLRAKLVAFAASPDQTTFTDVMRMTLQGDLLLDMTGSDLRMSDDGSAIGVGSTLGFAQGTGPDGGRALFAYTNQAEVVRAHPDAPDDVRTLAQPAVATLEFAIGQGYQWLYLDNLGATCGLTLSDMELVLAGGRNDEVRQALGREDAAAVHTGVVDALALGGDLYLSVDDETQAVRTSPSADGTAVVLAFTSAVEGAAFDPKDAFRALPVAALLDLVLESSLGGIVINPAGPWAELGLDDLRGIRAALPQ